MPKLHITNNMDVWEVNEQYLKWLTQCHVGLGVVSVGAQTFFVGIRKEADALYGEFKKHRTDELSAFPSQWDDKAKKLAARLAAMLSAVAPTDVQSTAMAIAQNLGEIRLQEPFNGA